jgi:hypothetical protein
MPSRRAISCVDEPEKLAGGFLQSRHRLSLGVGSERRSARQLVDLSEKAGVNLGSDSDLMMFSVELAILQRGNQDHASRHSNFVACAEWVGYRERK